MPIDLQITFRDSAQELHYVPLDLMYGEKPVENISQARKTYSAWPWTHPVYTIETSKRLTDIVRVEIDPSLRLADIDRNNNKLELKW